MYAAKPGKLTLTEEGLKYCGFKKGDKILDLGCGTGSKVAFLTEEFGLKCMGVYTDKKRIEEDLKNNPTLDLREMSCKFLDFNFHNFDGIMIKCIFSLRVNSLEDFRESYCVLRKDGLLFITDLYLKNHEEQEVLKM